MHGDSNKPEKEDVVDEETETDVEDDEEDFADEGDESDNVGDVSVEINVEELIAEIESAHDTEAARRREVRRRLEEIQEQKQALRDMEDTFMSYLDDDD